MSQTRILCPDCGFPLVYCTCRAMTELKNCPFCGSEPEIDWDGKHWTIKCYCGVSNGHTITKQDAIKAWNTRADCTCRTTPRPDNTVCPECSGKLSFGLSEDKWVCTKCGLLSRNYYEENQNDRSNNRKMAGIELPPAPPMIEDLSGSISFDDEWEDQSLGT